MIILKTHEVYALQDIWIGTSVETNPDPWGFVIGILSLAEKRVQNKKR